MKSKNKTILKKDRPTIILQTMGRSIRKDFKELIDEEILVKMKEYAENEAKK